MLTEQEVVDLVTTVLSPFGQVYDEFAWDNLVDQLLERILQDKQWKTDELYPGGKMLDNVVDTMLCLSTAISYSVGNAHVWLDEPNPEDGHIIGPGDMQHIELPIASGTDGIG